LLLINGHSLRLNERGDSPKRFREARPFKYKDPALINVAYG